MADYHILFGFKGEKVIPKIVAAIRNEGHKVTYTERTSKESITAYLEKNPTCEYAVLRECLGPESFSARELANLTDTRDINIVALIDSEHKGTSFMDTLYAAGITSAIIVDSKHGATAGKIAELLLRKRTRKAARKYYGLQDGEVRIEILTYGEYVLNYSILMNDELGLNKVDRFLGIANKLSAKQLGQFIASLPGNVLKELQGYEEFWFVIEALRKYKININLARPTTLKRALTEEQFKTAIQEDYDLKRKKGIPGPPLSEKKEELVETEEDKSADGTEKETEDDVVEMPVLQQNYFEEELRREAELAKKAEEKKAELEKSVDDGNKEEESDSQVSSPKSERKDVQKVDKKEKQEAKKKGKFPWKYTILITLISVALIIAWCYLVFVYKI